MMAYSHWKFLLETHSI